MGGFVNGLIELLVPGVAAVITGGCAAYVGLQKQAAPGARACALMLLSQAFWSVGYVAELLAKSLEGKVFWDNVQLPPPYVAALALLFFAFEYTGRATRTLHRRLVALSILPVASCAWVFSDGLHHRARATAHLVADPPFGALLYDFSAVEWLSFLEVYAVSGYACYWLLKVAAQQAPVHRKQAWLVAGSLLLGLLGNVPGLLGSRWFGQRDSSPLWFALSGLSLTWALTRYRLFDLVPIARAAVIEHLPDPVLVLDQQNRLLDVNPAARALFGRDGPRLGGPALVSLPSWLQPGPACINPTPEVRELKNPEGEASYEVNEACLLGPQGELRGRALILRDVTERRRARVALERAYAELEERVSERTLELRTANASLREQIRETQAARAAAQASEEESARLQEQLYQAQKLDSLGRLAGGVAHDFNNLLTAIIGNVELARMRETLSAGMTEHLLDIESASFSAAALTRQLLAFGRRQILEPRVIDLNGTVSNVRKLLARLLGEDIQLQLELEPELWRVKVDPSHAEQMLVNLAVNARDAMPRGGKLTLRTENRPASLPAATGAASVDAVVVSVMDQGSGIHEETLPRIFEPFFTTKPPGLGAGLGLAMVYGAMQQASGFVEVASQVGTGTTFTLHFPRSTENISAASELPRLRPPRGTETVALVEDQGLVRGTTQRQLEALGYRVLPFATVAEALPPLLVEPDLSLLITDVVLAGSSGRDLAEQLCRARPDLSVLYVSGYTEDVVLRHGIELGEVHFLAKPYTVNELAGVVRAILDGRPREPPAAAAGPPHA